MTTGEKLDELIATTGDSRLLDYVFRDGVLSFALELDDDDAVVRFAVPTEAVIASFELQDESARRACFVDAMDPSSVLRIENGHFVPGRSFTDWMKESKAALHLAYGRKACLGQRLLCVRAARVLLACWVEDWSQVSFEVDAMA